MHAVKSQSIFKKGHEDDSIYMLSPVCEYTDSSLKITKKEGRWIVMELSGWLVEVLLKKICLPEARNTLQIGHMLPMVEQVTL